MGVKRTQKTTSASLQKKIKQASSHSPEDDGNKTKSDKGRWRAPKKNYYESDNSYLDDSDADPDFGNEFLPKRQHKRKMDGESSCSDDDILTKAKRKKPRQVKVKKKIPSAKKRKSKKDSSDSSDSSDESEVTRNKSPFSKDCQPLLSSEGSDSDTIVASSCTKNTNKLKSNRFHKVENTKEPVTSFKLINKSIDSDSSILEKKDLNVKMKCESKGGIWEEKNLEDSEEDMKEIKMEVKIDPDDKLNAVKEKKESKETKTSVKEKKESKETKTSVKEKKDSKKSAATRKGKAQCKKENDSSIKEIPNAKMTKKNSKSKSTKSAVAKKEKKSSKINDLNDVSAVLMQFEGKRANKILSDSEESAAAEDSSESDWEEVEDDPSVPSTSSGKPQETIEITLEQKQFVKKKKNVGNFDWKAFFRRQMNVFKRELRIAKHKVHLLCLIGHGMVLNKLCCDPVLKALSFSLVPVINKQNFTTGEIKTILTAFSTSVQIKSQKDDVEAPTYSSIVKAFSNGIAKSTKEYTMMVVMALRSVGLKVRLVISFDPFPLKEPKEEKKKKITEEGNPTVKKIDNSKKSKVTKNKPKEKSKIVKKDPKKVTAQEKRNQIDDNSLTDKKNRPSRTKSQISYKEPDGSDFDEDEVLEEKKSSKKTLASKVSEKKKNSLSSGSSSDFEEDSVKFATVKRTQPKSGHKIISSSSSNNSFADNQDNITETWIEVYLDKEKRWLSVDCIHMVFDDLAHFENLDSRPLSYILTFDNDGYLKDVTPRYSSQWMLKTRKLRVQEEWWEKTMKPYLKKDKDNEREDTQIQANLLNQPLPKAISEYKNHPLYVLKRHLLKFEAIYPNSAMPLGYIRNEPVYARECVHQLHARETWMKEGRNVKVGEEPYKMVKSRPKWNKPKENPDIPDLPVFGLWQTEVYVPPPAVDGKIPRNEYGNVELYKPTMLPAGTVHLKEPGLNKVARKLGFDCAAAMVGWDFHGGSSHPVFDGWVVCVEHKEMILKEWEKDQERARLREIEKREKRIYGNWKKLIRGLLIRERLKKKYDLMEPEFIEEEQEEADDAPSSWPQNRKKENVKTTKSKLGKKKDDCKS